LKVRVKATGQLARSDLKIYVLILEIQGMFGAKMSETWVFHWEREALAPNVSAVVALTTPKKGFLCVPLWQEL